MTISYPPSPFEYYEEYETKLNLLEFNQGSKNHYGLDDSTAKSLSVANPVFEHDFCRQRIQESRSRGSSGEGMKLWLKRRFKLSDKELEAVIFGLLDPA